MSQPEDNALRPGTLPQGAWRLPEDRCRFLSSKARMLGAALGDDGIVIEPGSTATDPEEARAEGTTLFWCERNQLEVGQDGEPVDEELCRGTERACCEPRRRPRFEA